jgi:glycosyltransferase involved in cell wall biosynthesis
MKKILITLPTYNEENILEQNTLKVFDFCQAKFENYDWQILIADNGSTDQTPQIAEQLTKNSTERRFTTNYKSELITNRILFFHISNKGRGYALKKAWSNEFPADIYVYMDIDLSSDLNALPLLVEALENGYQLATGSRLKMGNKTERSISRELMSQGYNFLLKSFFQPSFEDAQCGFKAITKEVAEKILPKVKNNNWFFDTEMMILAEKTGYKIKEIPIEWLEKRAVKRKSTVKILATVWEDIKGMLELKKRLKK